MRELDWPDIRTGHNVTSEELSSVIRIPGRLSSLAAAWVNLCPSVCVAISSSPSRSSRLLQLLQSPWMMDHGPWTIDRTQPGLLFQGSWPAGRWEGRSSLSLTLPFPQQTEAMHMQSTFEVMLKRLLGTEEALRTSHPLRLPKLSSDLHHYEVSICFCNFIEAPGIIWLYESCPRKQSRF